MNAPTSPPNSARDIASELAAALDWWREAGVDSDMGDGATDWLADATPVVATDSPPETKSQPAKKAARAVDTPAFAPATKPQEQLGGDKSGWPIDLAAFQKWWIDEPSLDDGGATPRISPRGEAGARLMVVIPHPEQSDSDTLLSGPQGNLLEAMLRAMQISPEDTYLAAALTRHTPLPDWDNLQAGGLGHILAHHIALVAPKRLLLLGRRILPLLPHNTAQGSVALREFNHDSANVPAAAGAGLDTMLAQPGEKARFWRRWLEWTA